MRVFACLWCLILSFAANAQQARLVLPVGHVEKIQNLQFSPDGKWLLTNAENTKIWEASSGKVLYTFDGRWPVSCGTFSPDGQLIATVRENTVYLWKFSTGTLLDTLSFPKNSMVSGLRFSPGGKFLVVRDCYRALIFDLATRKPLATLTGHLECFEDVRFSPDERWVVTSSDDGTATVWDLATGKVLHTLTGHMAYISSLEISPDGQFVSTTAMDSTAKIWDPASGALIRTIQGQRSATFSPDGKFLLTCWGDSARLYAVPSGTLIRSYGHTMEVLSAHFSPDGQYVVTSAREGKARVWELATGRLIQSFGHSDEVDNALFSPDGQFIATSYGKAAQVWEAFSGKAMAGLNARVDYINDVTFGPDDRTLEIMTGTNRIRSWNIAKGQVDRVIHDPAFDVQGHKTFSPDRAYFATTTGAEDSLKLYLISGRLLYGFPLGKSHLERLFFSPDSRYVAGSNEEGVVTVWEVFSGKQAFKWRNGKLSFALAFSSDGRYLFISSKDTVFAINTRTALVMEKITVHKNYGFVIGAQASSDGKYTIVESLGSSEETYNLFVYAFPSGQFLYTLPGMEFSIDPGSRYLATVSRDSTVSVYDIGKGSVEKHLMVSADNVYFSRDGKHLVTHRADGTFEAWDTKTWDRRFEIPGHSGYDSQGAFLEFSHKGDYVATYSGDHTIRIWNRAHQLVYSLLLLDGKDFLVLDTVGRFDGTEAARKLLYYACGNDIIDLEQIKDLAWEPRLVEKAMGLDKEPFIGRRTEDMDICNKSPLVYLSHKDSAHYVYSVVRRSGGMGSVTVLINGKEIDRFNGDSLVFLHDTATLILEVGKYTRYFEPGKDNTIELKAYTGDMFMTSRGGRFVYQDKRDSANAPDLYAVVAGVSDYKEAGMHLKFAAKDALDFSNALSRSARRLLNVDGKEHVFVHTLVSGGDDPPTKENISRAFADIREKALAADILVVYIAGHGLKYGTEATNFYYLTADAGSFDLEGVTKDVAISTNEFADWLNGIAANKQVMILDACASGKLAEDMRDALGKREGIPSSQIKALDRLNSRTGTFILSGAAANQSAYETSIYGQGLLTYSLLYGMKTGTALGESKYVDVDRLFQFSADKVRELARDIGGVQDPVITKPFGGNSFDIGEVDPGVAASIQLALPKPIFTNSSFQNEVSFKDNLGLSALLDSALNQTSERGSTGRIVFADRSQLPDSYSLNGRYRMLPGNRVSIRGALFKGVKEVHAFSLVCPSDQPAVLVGSIIIEASNYCCSGRRP